MRELRRVILEALLIAAIGLCIGLTANAVSPRGLPLLVNHFRKVTLPLTTTTSPAVDSPETTKPAQTEPAKAESPAEQRLKQLGLKAIHFDEVVKAYNDPMYAHGFHVIIDARNDEHYAEGHIPRAHQLDHYYAGKYLPQLMPIVQQAAMVIVYCNGGDCEDSELAASDLLQKGAIPDRVYVYIGGIAEWKARGMPLETGPRGSGQITGGSAQPGAAQPASPERKRGGSPEAGQ